jgi:hypothetical protein
MRERAFFIIDDGPGSKEMESLLSNLKLPRIPQVEYIDCSGLTGKTGLAKHILGVDRIDEFNGDLALVKLVSQGRSFALFGFEKNKDVATSAIHLAVSLYNSKVEVKGYVILKTTGKLFSKQPFSILSRFRLIERHEGTEMVSAKWLTPF